jgi:5'(3')-deoxyribonucleotidase
MTERRRVLLDVDGVIADFLTPAIQVMEEVSGQPLHPEALNDWNLFRNYDGKTRNKFYEVFHSKGWCLNLKPYEGALEGVNLLRTEADVYFVTSPMHGPYWAYERACWLQKYFDAKLDHIIQTNAKHVCTGRTLVDDKPDHAENWQRANPKSVAILWDRQYNQRSNHYPRGDSWEWVLEVTMGNWYISG